MSQAIPSYPLSSRPQLRIIGEEDRPTYDGEPSRKYAAGFTMIPDAVRALKDGDALAVYEAIARHFNTDGEAWPSLKTICEHTGYSKNHVLRQIKKLEDNGLLVRQTRTMNGAAASTKYTSPANVRMFTTGTTLFTTETGVVHQENRGCSPQGHELDTWNVEPRNEKTPSKSPSRQKSAPAYTEDFERFWKDYPSGRGNKFPAFKHWQRMSADDRREAQRVLPQWVRAWGDPKYIPYCETWLGERRWENDPPVKAKSSNPNAGGQRRWVEG